MAFKRQNPKPSKALPVNKPGGTKFYAKNPSKVNKGKAKVGNK